jgi:hypothetical protein
MHYVKYKREKSGKCNICKREGPLTWDHVPPKGSIEPSAVEMQTMLQALSGNSDLPKYKISQNGVKFRTICENCNNLLGGRYDPVLNAFANDVGQFLRSKLALPSVVKIPTKLQLCTRAILGHLLAAKIELDASLFDEQVRGFLFDDSAPQPKEIHVFYWIYPYKHQVVVRDIGMPAKRGNFSDFAVFQILKYFPIAYLITDVSDYEGLPAFTKYRSTAITETVEVNIYLDKLNPVEWPEAPDRGNIVLMGQSGVDSLYSRPRTKTKRKRTT